ncbi:hypothetical protein K435DRAFT_102321 [Dendrothele bispora CBS 962.96]|uniref:Uncharacterized protein n=1 Tax=Dendrothele bispora (strain CBS 962.96) TaxID=1314807 RepID=A0A4S8KPG4_DENBC|nr:hypothetical protein K435DRAFT_102321 [Dendrothele bispora CBS 962.96]
MCIFFKGQYPIYLAFVRPFASLFFRVPLFRLFFGIFCAWVLCFLFLLLLSFSCHFFLWSLRFFLHPLTNEQVKTHTFHFRSCTRFLTSLPCLSLSSSHSFSVFHFCDFCCCSLEIIHFI